MDVFLSWLREIGGIIGSIGGIGAIIYGVANWWGNRIAEKISSKERAMYEQEVEKLKAQLEITKIMAEKYNEQKFILYNRLWADLFELRSIGDQLWESAETQNLMKFVRQLKSTREAVEKGSLFIEDDHYQQLCDILDAFSNYEVGKRRLIELRESNGVQEYEIRQIVSNKQYLNHYIVLIHEIRRSFRQQLNIQIN